MGDQHEDERGQEDGHGLSTPPARVTRSRRAVLVAVTVGVVLLGVLLRLSPGPGPRPLERNPAELLEDASFELATVRGGPWTNTADRNRIATAVGEAVDGRRFAVLRPVSGQQRIRQDVALGARDDRSYRASAYVRAAGGAPVSGVLTAATNCAAPERTDTAFRAQPGRWTVVTATINPRHGETCSLRWELALDVAATNALHVDAVSFTDAGLLDASFEQAELAGWEPNIEAERTTLTVVRDPVAAVDGASFGRVRAAGPRGSVVQDVVLDASSEAIVAVLTLSARRAPVAQPEGTVPITVAVWLLCPEVAPWNVAGDLDVGDDWQQAEVQLRSPGTLIRPNNDACTVRGEIYVSRAGGVVDVDAARLVLRSAKPAKP